MKKYLPFLLMAVVFFAVYQYCFDSKLDLNGDNASYIQLGMDIPMCRHRALLPRAISRPAIRCSWLFSYRWASIT